MKKLKLLYEGKAKQIYETTDDNIVLIEYKDKATAFNGQKKEEILGKGYLNNQISCLIFKYLEENGFISHFIKEISNTEMLAKKLTIIPIEVVVRNIVAGSLSKRLGLEEGLALETPIVEFYYKNDELGDPLVTEDHICMLNIVSNEELNILRQLGLTVNKILIPIFKSCNMTLVDFKLEFGITLDGEIILADEISPDTCRIWDIHTNKKLDKDVFRRDLGNIVEVYEEVYKRLKKEVSKCIR